MSQHPRILLVDDDPMTCELVSRRLEHDHYEVRTAMSAGDCLHASSEEPPDLVLLDAGLEDGDAVARRLGEEPSTAATPIILMTGPISGNGAHGNGMNGSGMHGNGASGNGASGGGANGGGANGGSALQHGDWLPGHWLIGDWQPAGTIAKPFSPDQLLSTIRSVLERHGG